MLDLSRPSTPVRSGTAIVIVKLAPGRWRVGGLAVLDRAVWTACRAGFETIRLAVREVAAGERRFRDDPRLAGRTLEVVPRDDAFVALGERAPRWVVLADVWVVEAEHLIALAETAQGTVTTEGGGPFVAAADGLARRSPSDADEAPVADAALAAPGVRVRAADEAGAERATDALFAGLAQRTDGTWLARHVDRPASRWISRRLVRTAITPNQITIASMAIGVLGALVLLHPSHVAGAAGCLLFLLSTILDGCDGEIARLEFAESAWGAKLDVIGDNVVHAVLFPCLALRVHAADPEGPYLWLGLLALGGVVLTWIVVWWTVVRRPPTPATRRLFERFANREFAYLLAVLGLVGRLDAFVWVLAIGLWVFPMALVVTRSTRASHVV